MMTALGGRKTMASPDDQPRRSFLFSFGIDRLGLLALQAPYVSAAIIVLLTLLAVWGVSKMKVDDSLSELFRTDTKEFVQYEEIDRRFPSSEYDVLVVVEGKDLLQRPQLEAFRNVAVELQLTDGVGGIVSMMSARGKPDPSGYAPPVVPDDLPEDAAEYDKIIGSLRANDIVKGKFLSDDGTLALIVIALDRAMVEERSAKAVIGGIKAAVDEQLRDTGLTAKLTGAPVMQLEIRNAVERDRLVYNGLGFVVGMGIAYLFFRRLSLTLIAVLGPTIAILWTLGVIGGLDFRLNLFVNVITPLILVSGFSDSMHLVFAIRRDIMRGVDRIEAARNAVLDVAPACLLTAMNAALAILSFQFAESALIRTFGTAALLAVAISYIAVAVVVPTLAVLLIQKEDAPMPANTADETGGVGLLQRVTDVIMGAAARNPVPFFAMGVLAAIATGWAYMQLVPMYRLADQVPDKEQALAATSRLDQKLTGANPVHVMISWKSDGTAPAGCEKEKKSQSDAAPASASSPGVEEPAAAPGDAPAAEVPDVPEIPATDPPDVQDDAIMEPNAGTLSEDAILPEPTGPADAVAPSAAAKTEPGPAGDTSPSGITLYDVGTLSVIKQAHDVLEKEAGLGNVWSLDSLRRWLAETGDASIPTIKSYVCILPEHLVRRFIAEDETAVLVTARMPDVDASEILPKVELIDRALEPVRQDHPGYDIAVTGLPAIAARNSAKLIGELNWGLVGDMFVIFIFLGIALRSMLAGVASVLPSLLPIFSTGALLWASGQGLQFASIIAITVAFSLAIDSTIHFLNRFRLEEERLGGGPGSEFEALKRTAHHIGPAVVLTTIVLAMGLGVTMLSHLPSLRLFGQLAAACLFVSLLCQLLVLPATIALYRRFIPRNG
jgi:predicted RND superfamily exporter protein